MKIEVLYFDGCPNHKPAVERVQELLREGAVSAEVLEVNVSEASIAQEFRFLGSPSVRVNGLDVEPEARSAREYGMMCRTYAVNGRREGLPSHEMLRQAIREARSGISNSGSGQDPSIKSKGPSSLFAMGSVFAAIVASFCCILPIAFAVTGFSILGASALFDAWRPYLLGLTFALLGLGFYFAYRPRKEHCAPGSACTMPVTNRWGRLMLWLASVAVVLFAAFPYYSGAVAELVLSGTSAATNEAPKLMHASFIVQGMDCAACASAVESKLKALKGVQNVAVSAESRKADVDYDAGSATILELENAIKNAGYEARKI